MIRHVILRVLSKLLIPLIMLFALYVQFHGDYGPGGGFQAGVIFGAAIILYALMFGLEAAKRVFPPRVLEFLVAFGLLLYGSVGVTAILDGDVNLFEGEAGEVPMITGRFLPYSSFSVSTTTS